MGVDQGSWEGGLGLENKDGKVWEREVLHRLCLYAEQVYEEAHLCWGKLDSQQKAVTQREEVNRKLMSNIAQREHRHDNPSLFRGNLSPRTQNLNFEALAAAPGWTLPSFSLG